MDGRRSGDRVAVVTGGASGMGRACCLELARRGHDIAVIDIDNDGADDAASMARSLGRRACGFGVDITDRPSLDEAFRQIRDDLGPTQVLVTSAGVVGFEPFLDMSIEAWDRLVAVNLTGTFHSCQAALPDMVRSQWGRIVTISSSSAQRGSPRMAHYAASKGGVIALTKSLAREFAPSGITVNNVPPSGIVTPMQRQSQEQGLLPPDDVMAKTIPLGHLGTGEDIAAAVGFLCSEEAGFITGQVLGVNGGAVL